MRNLYIVNADGTGLRQLTSTPENEMYPTWSPDGESIAYHFDCNLAFINPDGFNPRITSKWTYDVPLCFAFPMWSPDNETYQT